MIMTSRIRAEEIKANHTYFCGSSSSPSLVIVLSVDDRRVTVANPHGETMKRYALDRTSANMSIAKGGRTMREQAERSPDNEGLAARSALHGAPVTPRDWDIYHVSVRPVSGEWDSNENWRAAEEFGNVGGHVATQLLSIDRCRGASLAELVTDNRFVVVSMALVEECGRS